MARESLVRHPGSGRVCHVFRKKKKGGNDKKMITLNDIINDNTQPVQGKMITQKW